MKCIFNRLRDILNAAPWSNHDLLSALMLFLIGFLFLCQPNTFDVVGGGSLYASMAQLGEEWQWGLFFIGVGGGSLIATLWYQRPPFLIRLISRLSVVFCFLSLMLNHLAHPVIPPATILYGGLSVWSLWGAIRTHSSGR